MRSENGCFALFHISERVRERDRVAGIAVNAFKQKSLESDSCGVLRMLLAGVAGAGVAGVCFC